MPADFIASILSEALPLPPEMTAPAWPMRRPGGALTPAMKPTMGFFRFSLGEEFGGLLLGAATDLADHDNGLRVVVGEKQFERIDEARAVALGSPPMPITVVWPSPAAVVWATAS